MAFVLNQNKTLLTSAGALLVISSKISKQLIDQPNMLSMAMCVAGWSIIAWAIGSDMQNKLELNNKMIISGLCAAGILFASYMKQGDPDNMIWKLLCAGSFIGLGYIAGMGKSMMHQILGFVGPLLCMFATMYVLPVARMNGAVDNPGYAICMMGFLALVLANSMQ